MTTRLIFLILSMAARAPSTAPVPAHNPNVGYYPDHAIQETNGVVARIDALNPEWLRDTIGWDTIEPVRGHRDWTRIKSVMDFYRAKGYKLMLCPAPYPDWLAALPFPEWLAENKSFIVEMIAELHPDALEIVNEPCCARPDQKWGYIPGIKPFTPEINATILAIYQAARSITKLPLAGPSFSKAEWWPDAKALKAAGVDFDIWTAHCYAAKIEDLPVIAREWRALAGTKPVFWNEFTLLPQTMPASLTQAQAEKQVSDAITAALVFRKYNVVPFPHTLMQRSPDPLNGGYAGYEQGIEDSEPFKMKAWCRWFLWVLRLGLTDRQLAVQP